MYEKAQVYFEKALELPGTGTSPNPELLERFCLEQVRIEAS